MQCMVAPVSGTTRNSATARLPLPHNENKTKLDQYIFMFSGKFGVEPGLEVIDRREMHQCLMLFVIVVQKTQKEYTIVENVDSN